MTDLVSLKQDQTDPLCDDQIPALITINMAALHEGQQVLNGLNDPLFVASCQPTFRSTLGAHFRHLIEHYICFLNCLDSGKNLICYASRPRDGRIETDRTYALDAMGSLLERLAGLNECLPESESLFMRDQDGLEPVSTNIERELLFLQSHTIHHHAIIAAMCRLLGHPVPDNFGIAIATQAFEAAQQASEVVQQQVEAS